ncbi:MAG: LTA synthase family protein [Lachnospiraceae bacterium]|nr:LTA synthase family protein [Lachnospiraceae bacterium]
MKNWLEKGKDWLYQLKGCTLTFLKACCLPALVCCLFVELCSRTSVSGLFLYLLNSPFVFLYNVLIIAATAVVCLLFKRRSFVLMVVLFLWAVIGVTDMILLSFRTTPFTAVDLLLIKSALTIMNRYMSPFMIVLVIVALVAAFFGLFILFKKAKKVEGKINYFVALPFCALVIAGTMGLSGLGMSVGLLDRNFGNLAQAFHDNGLPWCFMNSLLNTGIDRPDGYSPEEIQGVLGEIEEDMQNITGSPVPDMEGEVPTQAPTATPAPTEPPEESATPLPTGEPELTQTPAPTEEPEPTGEPESKEYPNILFLQLESFFDPKYIENASFSTDPIPFFTYLKEHYPSGFVSVPSIGAGTANTEFECIAGMNLDMFGPGEYPYKTLLKDRTCESIPYALKKLGYETSAIHNNDGTFYGRNEVFATLGFDYFISQEYMRDTEFNELGWMRDSVLTKEIVKVLRKTPGQDYIYTISVQGHGAYPEEPLLENPVVDVRLPEELSEYYYQYLYYVNQLYEMDLFLKELVLTLTAYPEDVVLVLYGDHLPSLGLSEALLENGDLFQTDYVIWSNFELEAEDKDLQAYQLGAHVCNLLDIHEGVMMQFHQTAAEDEDYLEKMQLLMYDMLYGDMEAYGGINPYEKTDLVMGIEPQEITNVYIKYMQVSESDPLLYVTGKNFTEWSRIVINGKEVETIYLNSQLLAAVEIPKSELDEEIYYFSVRQAGSDDIVLSETAKYLYEKD